MDVKKYSKLSNMKEFENWQLKRSLSVTYLNLRRLEESKTLIGYVTKYNAYLDDVIEMGDYKQYFFEFNP